MKVAFTGTSGAGKTTLVKYVAEKYGLPWISGSSGDLKTQEDKDRFPEIQGKGHEHVIVQSALNPYLGWENQLQILQRRKEAIENNSSFVTDRSPVDNMVYMLMQCAYHKEIDDHMVSLFKQTCLEAWSKLTHVIYIKPCQPEGIENNNSRVTNLHYQQSIDAVFNYWLMEFSTWPGPYILKLTRWDLENRKSDIDRFLTI